jgi:hypothetical protein
MGWSIGYDDDLQRDIGYGVPATCDHPDCQAEIDRGIAYVCGSEIYGGEHGCGLHFCDTHRYYIKTPDGAASVCRRCRAGKAHFPVKPDRAVWIQHKLTDPSWAEWRAQHPESAHQLQALLATKGVLP